MTYNLLDFWGKARPIVGSAAAYHPALLHCLDVAAAAQVLAEEGLATGVAELTPLLPFLASIHDVGKFSRGFQQQCPELWPERAFGPLKRIATPRHDTLGYWLLRLHCGDILDVLLPDTPDRGMHAVLRAVAGHHGSPPLEPDPDDRYPPGLCKTSAAVAREAVTALCAALAPPAVPGVSRVRSVQLSWNLAGVVNLADWLGSGPEFPYADAAMGRDLPGYFHHIALPRARQAVARAGLRPASARRFTGLTDLFPAIAMPSPVQLWAESVDLPEGPVLALIEDVTGSGKTEAALALAHRLLACGRADGLFVGLPTMATAGAMFARLQDSYRRLFGVEPAPSLALAHGRARLDARFNTTILAENDVGDISDDAVSASSQCTAWLADGGRKALLAQIGVGTLDQAVLAVLPVRYAALRQIGLSRKILIIDEVHAYDHYMRAELSALLRLHAAAGGSAILLSATVTRALRGDLTTAFMTELGGDAAAVCSTAYPLTTLVAASGVREQPCGMRDGLARRVTVRRIGGVAEAVAEITSAAARGAAVAWIRNTVDDAIAGWQALEQAGVTPVLFHARFAMADRLRIEQDVLSRFGKASAARAGVVVATQVIEQSLDLDFDLIVTDMAPADLLVQRAGRLWRHAGRADRPLPAPEMLLLGPVPVEAPAPDWLSGALPGTSYIYPAALVWRSARALLGAGAIETPGNVRALVEAAYDENGTTPEGLARSANDSIAEMYVARSLAQMNLLDQTKGYSMASGVWESDARTPTRLEEGPTVTLRLARVAEDGRVVPWAEDAAPDLAWALSEVRVAASRVTEIIVPMGVGDAAAAARSGWGRWEREAVTQIKLVVLTPNDGAWRAEMADGKGRRASLSYAPAAGLVWSG